LVEELDEVVGVRRAAVAAAAVDLADDDTTGRKCVPCAGERDERTDDDGQPQTKS
jgi:hypothetical protein